MCKPPLSFAERERLHRSAEHLARQLRRQAVVEAWDFAALQIASAMRLVRRMVSRSASANAASRHPAIRTRN